MRFKHHICFTFWRMFNVLFICLKNISNVSPKGLHKELTKPYHIAKLNPCSFYHLYAQVHATKNIMFNIKPNIRLHYKDNVL